MVEAEVVETATETNGLTQSEPIEKLNTVGEEKKVLLRQNHYNSNIVSNNSLNHSLNTNGNNEPRQRNNPIFSNPIKQHTQQINPVYKRSSSPWQQTSGGRNNYWSGQKIPYQPYITNNVNNNYNSGYRSEQTETLSKTNLYIRGLPNHMTDDELANMCKGFGKITSTKAITDKQSNKCKGYGFVDFESPNAAQEACQYLTLQGTQASFAKMSINDQLRKQNDPTKVKQQSDNIDTTNLYISNLPRSFTEEQLNTLVAPFGDVVSSRILKDPEGTSKGVGFARLESKEQCEKGIKALNGKPLHAGGDPLIVKFAEAPNPNKKRSMVFCYQPSWVGNMEENSTVPAMSFVQPVYSDSVVPQNGAAAIPHTPSPRQPLFIHPSMPMVPMYNNLPNGTQWIQSPQIVPQPFIFPAHLSPVDHHALASQMSQLQLSGGYVGGNPYATPYTAAQTSTVNDEQVSQHQAPHTNYTIYAPRPVVNGEAW